MLQFIIIYCFFSYLFMLGVWSQADGLKRHMYLLAPITLPFIVGRVVITQHVFNAKKLLKIKREEDERARKEKEKADAQAKAEAEKAEILKLERALADALRQALKQRPIPNPFLTGSGLAKEFNDMMRRNPFNW